MCNRPPTADRRRKLAAWVRDHGFSLRKVWVAHAVLVASTFDRGLYTALLWLVKPPCPVRAFEDEDGARAWLQAQWVARG